MPTNHLKRLGKLGRWGSQLLSVIPRKLFVESRHPPLLILMYHRVCETKEDHHLLCVHPDRFRQQMAFLAQYYSPIPLCEWNNPERKPKVKVAVTFDDGYADNYHQAFPILEELGIPFTLFVCTQPVEQQQELPTDRFDCVIDQLQTNPVVSDTLPEWLALGLSRPLNRSRLHDHFYRLPPVERHVLLAALERTNESSPVCREKFRPLTVLELQKLARSPLATIGAHTLHHPRLSSLDPQDQERELTDSKRQIEEWLQKPVQQFAYPYGRQSDFNLETAHLCEKVGFTLAVTTEPAQAWSDSPPFRLPRFPIRNWSLPTFRRMLGFYQWL